MGAYRNTLLCQYGLGHGAGKYQRRCKPSGKMPAPPVIVKAFIADLAGIIRMTGTHHVFQQTVIPGVLVAVRYQHTKRSPRSSSLKHAAFNDIRVFFLTLGAHPVLPRGAPRHFFFYKSFINRRSRRQPVQHKADPFPARIACDQSLWSIRQALDLAGGQRHAFRTHARELDLAGKSVIVQAASSGLSALDELPDLTATFGELLECADYNSAFMELGMGTVDAVVADVGVAEYNMRDKDGQFRVLDEAVSVETYGVGFLKGSDELAAQVWKSMQEIAADGTMASLADKYVPYGLVKENVTIIPKG